MSTLEAKSKEVREYWNHPFDPEHNWNTKVVKLEDAEKEADILREVGFKAVLVNAELRQKIDAANKILDEFPLKNKGAVKQSDLDVWFAQVREELKINP